MDRTEGNTNTLLDASGSEIHVIDHNGAFDATFDEEQFLKNHIFRDAFLALSPKDRQKMADEIHQTVASFDLDAVWYEMPDAWADETGTGLTLDDVRGILFTRWSPLP